MKSGRRSFFCAIAAAAMITLAPRAIAGTAPPGAADATSTACLTRLNYYRLLAGLNPIKEDASLSRGDLDHARYLVKRIESDASAAFDAHGEDVAYPWATPSGARAAAHCTVALRSNMDQSAGLATQASRIVDDWMTEPFQRLHLLDPSLSHVGVGIYAEKAFLGVALQVSASDPDNDEISSEAEYISARRAAPPAGKYPIMFPPPNSQISLNVYEGGEWPEPLAAFPDYRLPSGLPITLELGPDAQTNPITDHQVIADGRSIEHQIFDATSYAGASPDQTGDGRAILKAFGAIVLVPKHRLLSKANYAVSVTAGGKQYRWSFTTYPAE